MQLEVAFKVTVFASQLAEPDDVATMSEFQDKLSELLSSEMMKDSDIEQMLGSPLTLGVTVHCRSIGGENSDGESYE